ncbi:MAG: DUF2520 domain-containing protein [Candidatus Hatepunaea meridiana]|nr:DUF2520 domain-containing protein [Candidatus Hatepunaea meridiana]
MKHHNFNPRIAVVGYGKVGKVLVKAFIQAGYELTGIVVSCSAKKPALKDGRLLFFDKIVQLPDETDFIVLCVRDFQIEGLAKEIVTRKGFHAGTVIAHTAGAVSAEILAPVRDVGALPLSWHPMQTFVGGEDADLLCGVTFGIDGDPEAVSLGEELAIKIGGIPFIVPPDKRTTYHLGAVMACNLMSGLVSMAMQLLKEAGMNDKRAMEALSPLIVKTAQNLSRIGLPDSISGPLRRGDEKTIGLHLDILEKHPDLNVVYRVLSRELLRRLGNEDNIKKLSSLLML